MVKVFIDGSQGTTGLRLHDRLKERKDIELLHIDEDKRKSVDARLEMVEKADVAFLCLPDAASRELIAAAKDCDTTILDTSTAFRCDDSFAYGFPELGPDFLKNVKTNHRISVPGCHASGSIAVLMPLVKNGLISPDEVYTITSLTGYSGGGKKMIVEYENPHDPEVDAPRIYAVGQKHKHLPEIKKYTGLNKLPVFLPIVAPYYSGMLVTVGFENKKGISLKELRELYRDTYNLTPFIRVNMDDEQPKMLGSNTLSGKDSMNIIICGNEERITVSSQFDNLGKGASGAAIECFNFSIGVDPTTGLSL
ncbi:MAG: N-acetyl-gamma-glutamyl-phosphate reductase [Acidaminococcus sp.]|jgi:N-acetyl-gamma-glutamyl-phosphate reductase|nr:N-acetyl-gamma-glutamyl-phosphate reductase [Acidaminococcus sp.]